MVREKDESIAFINEDSPYREKPIGTERETMSVTELRRLLGLCKSESYWLVHTDYAPKEVISSVREFEKEAEDPSVEYYYCSGNEIVNLFQTH